MKIKKAIIPVAGLGTRFLPATKAEPKELLPIVDKPALQYIVEEAVLAGIEDIIFITNRGKTSIENHFDRSIELELALEKSGKIDQLNQVKNIANLANIYYLRQKETLGLGHAILKAKSFIGNEPFAVLLGDDLVYSPDNPAIGQLMRIYEEKGKSIIGCQEVEGEEISKYGVIDGDKIDEDLYKINMSVEKPSIDKAPSNIAILGRHIFNPDIFDYLEDTKIGYGGEIQLTDAMDAMSKDQDVLAYIFQGRRYDIGDKQGYLEATVDFALRDPVLNRGFKNYLIKIVEELN